MEINRAKLNNIIEIAIGAALVIFIIAARLMPHAANFTPIIASGLFAGVYLRKKWSIFIPIIGLTLSNIFLPGNSIKGSIIVAGAVITASFIGRLISRKNIFSDSGLFKKIALTIGGVSAASLLFFLITNCNFLYGEYGMYPMNFTGMFQSYFAGMPFFRAQILGDIVFVFILFSTAEAVKYFAKNKAQLVQGLDLYNQK